MRSRGISVSFLRSVAVVVGLGGALLLSGIAFPGALTRHVVPWLLYVPGFSEPASPPAEHGLPRAEDVRLTAEDGVALHGWWVPAAGGPACGTVLFLHGNAGSVAGRAPVARRLSEAGFDVLLVDYRGYGRSEGEPDEEGLYLDARAAWRHAVEERATPSRRLAVAGNSLGSAVAAHLAAHRPVGAAVLTGAFASVPELAAEIYGWLPDPLFTDWPTHRFETVRWVRRIRAPLLVARGAEDDLVPEDQTRSVHGAAGPGAAWYAVPGAGHDDLWVSDAFWSRLLPFLEDALACR